MEVKIIRLVDGSELLAQVEEMEGSVKLHSARQLVQSPQGFALVPASLFIDDENDDFISVLKTHILWSATPRKGIAAQYKNALSPIETPSKSLIL